MAPVGSMQIHLTRFIIILALSTEFSVLNAQNFYVDFRPGIVSRVSYHNFLSNGSDGFFDLVLNERSVVPTFGIELGIPKYRSKFRANFYSIFSSTKVTLKNGSDQLSNLESFQSYYHFTYLYSFNKFDVGLGLSGYTSPKPEIQNSASSREGLEALALTFGVPVQNFDFVFRYDWLLWKNPQGGYLNVFIDEPTFFSLELNYPIRLTKNNELSQGERIFKNPLFVNFGLSSGFNPTFDFLVGQRSTRSYLDIGIEYLISKINLSMYFQRSSSLSFNELTARVFQNHSQQNVLGLIYWSRLNGKAFLKYGIAHSWEFHKIQDWEKHTLDISSYANPSGTVEKLTSAQFYAHKSVVFSLWYPVSKRFDFSLRYHLYYSSEDNLLRPFDYRNFLFGMTFKLN
jgi:hypothetical protein